MADRNKSLPPYRSANGLFKCRICNKEFVSFRALSSHQPKHIKSNLRMSAFGGRRHYSCSKCGKKFRAPQSLFSHMRRRHNPADLRMAATATGTSNGTEEEPLLLLGDGGSQPPIPKKPLLHVDLNLTPFENYFQNGVLFS